LRINPHLAVALYGLGVVAEQQGDPRLAIIDYRAALFEQPDHDLGRAALRRLGVTP
jgi:hypothetical protein